MSVAASGKRKVVKAKSPSAELEKLREVIEARWNRANEIFEYQDSLTREAIEHIESRLLASATGVATINGTPVSLPMDMVKMNVRFLAIEIVSDLAMFDIQVANYKFHPNFCGQCRKKLSKPIKSKR